MILICPKCGYRCADDAEYCPNCGLVFDDEYVYDYDIDDFFDDDDYDVLDLDNADEKNIEKEQPQVINRKPVWIWIIAVAVIAIAIIIIYFATNSAVTSNKKNNSNKGVIGNITPITETETGLGDDVVLQTLPPDARKSKTETLGMDTTENNSNNSNNSSNGIKELFETETLYYTQETTKNDCELLYGPGDQYASQGTVPAGANLYVMNTYNNYSFVEYNGTKGWIKNIK